MLGKMSYGSARLLLLQALCCLAVQGLRSLEEEVQNEGSDGNSSSPAQMIAWQYNGFNNGYEELTYTVNRSVVNMRTYEVTTPLRGISVEIQKSFAVGGGLQGNLMHDSDCDFMKLETCQDYVEGPCFTTQVSAGALNRRVPELRVRIFGLADAAIFMLRVTPEDKDGNKGLPVVTRIQSMPHRKYYFDKKDIIHGNIIWASRQKQNENCKSYRETNTMWQCKGGMKYCDRVELVAPHRDSSKCSLTTNSIPDCILWGVNKCKNKGYFVDMALGNGDRTHDPTCYESRTIGSQTVLCRLEIPLKQREFEDASEFQTELDKVAECQTPGCSFTKSCCCMTNITAEQNSQTCACSKRTCDTLSFFPAVDTKSACSH